MIILTILKWYMIFGLGMSFSELFTRMYSTKDNATFKEALPSAIIMIFAWPIIAWERYKIMKAVDRELKELHNAEIIKAFNNRDTRP